MVLFLWWVSIALILRFYFLYFLVWALVLPLSIDLDFGAFFGYLLVAYFTVVAVVFVFEC